MATRSERRPRHLIDPADLGKPRLNATELAAERASLNRVRRRVVSVLIVTTILHLVVGLVIAAFVLPSERTAARVGLWVIAGFFAAVAAVAAVRLTGRRGEFGG